MFVYACGAFVAIRNEINDDLNKKMIEWVATLIKWVI